MLKGSTCWAKGTSVGGRWGDGGGVSGGSWGGGEGGGVGRGGEDGEGAILARGFGAWGGIVWGVREDKDGGKGGMGGMGGGTLWERSEGA